MGAETVPKCVQTFRGDDDHRNNEIEEETILRDNKENPNDLHDVGSFTSNEWHKLSRETTDRAKKRITGLLSD